MTGTCGPDEVCGGALRVQDLAAAHHLGRHARRVEGGRRHRGVRVGLDVRPLLPITDDYAGPRLEGWTTLTALAQATTRLRMGTLDIVSGGRLELGIGAGWNEEESGAYGIELGTPRERSDRFEEACEVIVGLLTQETTTFAGRFYELTDARNEPKAVQRPHPAICIGESGETRTLRTAARFAQHWNFVGGTPHDFARKRDVCISTAPTSAQRPGRDRALQPPDVHR